MHQDDAPLSVETNVDTGRAMRTTLLSLVQSLARIGYAEHEIVASVFALLERKQVELTGSFRGAPLEHLREGEKKSSGR